MLGRVKRWLALWKAKIQEQVRLPTEKDVQKEDKQFFEETQELKEMITVKPLPEIHEIKALENVSSENIVKPPQAKKPKGGKAKYAGLRQDDFKKIEVALKKEEKKIKRDAKKKAKPVKYYSKAKSCVSKKLFKKAVRKQLRQKKGFKRGKCPKRR